MLENEIVSVIVLAYNSERTILETLESIAKQDYRKLELIVSDDSSKDNTLKIVEDWIKENKKRFEKIIVHSNEVNKGVSANLNIAFGLTVGNWVKIIAADDILIFDCISNNYNFVISNNIKSIVTSKIKPFKINALEKIYIENDNNELDYIKKISKLDSNMQYKKLLIRDILNSPTIFINREVFLKVGGCDERIRNIDDWPLKIKLTKFGYKIHFLDKETVMYRIGNSVSHTNLGLYNINHLKNVRNLKKIICYPEISKWNILYYYQELIILAKDWIIISILKNRNTILTRNINKILMILIPGKLSKIKKYLTKVIK